MEKFRIDSTRRLRPKIRFLFETLPSGRGEVEAGLEVVFGDVLSHKCIVKGVRKVGGVEVEGESTDLDSRFNNKPFDVAEAEGGLVYAEEKKRNGRSDPTATTGSPIRRKPALLDHGDSQSNPLSSPSGTSPSGTSPPGTSPSGTLPSGISPPQNLHFVSTGDLVRAPNKTLQPGSQDEEQEPPPYPRSQVGGSVR
ncbi:hypothetical protein L218DRAFT_948360 [Marasmius fiardii PR-910]|nr:hypothetical protein L218DRAFT_948360 [Marasmius fiardii PR-910]